MKKALVTYFSAGGVTAKAAKNLAEGIGADLFEIRPAVLYTSADLNWRDKQSRSSVEMQNKAFRPAISDDRVDVSGYDVIFVGFPIWWYVAPTIINTFLESLDLAGKTIVVFATSGGSGFGKTVEELKISLPDSAKIIEGKLIRGETPAELKTWAEGLDL